MASHLTIISGANGAVSARSLNGQQSAANVGSTPDVFASMLGGAANAPATPVAASVQSSTGTSETDAERLARLALEAGGGGDADRENADALAASFDLQQQADPANPKPVTDLVERLGEARAGLYRGELLEPDMLERIEDALHALAEALGLDLDALALPEDLAALLDSVAQENNGLVGVLAQLLAPLNQAQNPDGNAEAQSQLKSIGDKLAALLAALDGGAVGEDELAMLGTKPGTAPADEIKAALSRFAALLAGEGEVPKEPVLAAPTLKTSEPVLTGKSTETTTAPLASADALAAKDDGASNGDRPSPRDNPAPQRDARPTNTPAAAPADNNTSQAAAPASQDNGVLRLDPAAAPRVVQSGYQTSQQQLNLPQLAFELARQVQDGNTRFQIRLDPPELGRIDVRLDIDRAGQVNARLMVEKSETLDLMQRDQRALERALQQAGLDSAKTNLEFSLKQNPFAGQGDRHDRGEQSLFDSDPVTAEAEEAAPTVNLYRGSLQASGVNIIA